MCAAGFGGGLRGADAAEEGDGLGRKEATPEASQVGSEAEFLDDEGGVDEQMPSGNETPHDELLGLGVGVPMGSNWRAHLIGLARFTHPFEFSAESKWWAERYSDTSVDDGSTDRRSATCVSRRRRQFCVNLSGSGMIPWIAGVLRVGRRIDYRCVP